MAIWEDYLEAGLIPIPTAPGKRKPLVMWTEYRDQEIRADDIRTDWGMFPFSDPSIILKGVAVVDVDVKNARDKSKIYNTFWRALLSRPDLNNRIYVEETGTRGLHIWYRPPSPRSSSAIALTVGPDSDEKGRLIRRPVVELLGEGHLCRIFPSDGIKQLSGSPMSLDLLTEEECQFLERIGLLFNEYVPEVVQFSGGEKTGDGRPGDDYSNNVPYEEFLEVLQRHGYEYVKRAGKRDYIRRPGAKTKNFDCDIIHGTRVFMNYSSSVMDFEQYKGYSFFEVYVILEHGGNFSRAASALAERGYGAQRTAPALILGAAEKPKSQLSDLTTWPDDDDFADNTPEIPYDPEWEDLVLDSYFDLDNPPEIKFTFSWADYTQESPTRHDLSGPGTMILMLGKQKARKTAATCAVVAAAIRREPIIGFSLDVEPDGDIVFVDTEQPSGYYYLTQRKIMVMAGCRKKPANYHSYHLRKHSAAKRRKLLLKIVERHPKLALLVVDGARDLLTDINNNDQVTEVCNLLMAITSQTNCILFTILHVNKNDDNARGALGTELQNKADCIFLFRLNDSDDTEVIFRDIRGFRKPRPFIFAADGNNIPYIPGVPSPNYDDTIGRRKAPAADPNQFTESTKIDDELPF